MLKCCNKIVDAFFFTRSDIELLSLLVHKELKIRYAQSLLGYAWTMLIPLSFIVTYYLAFKVVMKIGTPHYIPFLATGIFVWFWTVNGIVQATPIYRQNLSLIKKVKINRAILPISIIVKELVHFLFAMPVIFCIIIFGTGKFYFSWIYLLPVMICLQFLFIVSIAVITSFVHVFVRDIEHLIAIVLNMVFFVTPIIYPMSVVPKQYVFLFNFNPFVPFISSWHSVWLNGNIGSGFSFFLCVFYALFMSLCAFFIYRRFSYLIGEWL
jgi:ABC-type polysaccharide/polyol phosphate export permease